MELVFSSSNESKLGDYRRIAARLTAKADSDEVRRMKNVEYVMRFSDDLFGFNINILCPTDIGATIEDVAETGMSLYENAGIKARAAYNILKRPVFADDSGNWINGIGGPAVFTGRYAEDRKNIKKCLEQLDTVYDTYSNTGAHTSEVITTTVICLITNDGKEHYFSGSLKGHIAWDLSKDDYENADDFEPGWTSILEPDLSFYTDEESARFTRRIYAGYRPTMSALGQDIYDDICPRHMALLNMLNYIKTRGNLDE